MHTYLYYFPLSLSLSLLRQPAGLQRSDRRTRVATWFIVVSRKAGRELARLAWWGRAVWQARCVGRRRRPPRYCMFIYNTNVTGSNPARRRPPTMPETTDRPLRTGPRGALGARRGRAINKGPAPQGALLQPSFNNDRMRRLSSAVIVILKFCVPITPNGTVTMATESCTNACA